MPRRWFHITLNTRGSWLHGDPRGFRDRRHRVHSSGNYKNPPPQGEHEELHRWASARSNPAVTIPADLRATVGERLIEKAASQGHRLLVVEVAGQHTHVLAVMPNDVPLVKREVGLWKQAASHAVRSRLPGRVWSEGCHAIRINGFTHGRFARRYILDHVEEGAWVWSVWDGGLRLDGEPLV